MEYGGSRAERGVVGGVGARRALLPSRAIMFMSFAAMSAVNYAFGLAAGWLLAPGDFGLLAFAQTLLTMAGLVLNSGFAWSLARSLVNVEGSSRGELVRGAAVSNLLIALGVSAVLALLYALGPLSRGLETWTVAALVAATLPPLSLLTIARAAAQGSERFVALATLLVLETVIKAGAGLGLVLLGYGAAGAVAGFLAGSAITMLVSLVYLDRKLGVAPWGRLRLPEFGLAGWMFAALLGMALLLNLDMVALKLLSSADRAEVGHYQAGIVLANLPYYLLSAMIPVLFTQAARVRHLSATVPLVANTVRLALVVLLPVEIALAAFPELFLGLLFPPAYSQGDDTLRILAAANSAIMFVAILSATFQAVGKPRIAGGTLLAVTLVEAAVLWFVVPNGHGRAAATVYLAATVTALLILGILYWRQMGPRAGGLRLGWLLRYAFALVAGMGAGWGGLKLTGSGYAALAAGGAAYAVAVMLFRLVSFGELLHSGDDGAPAAKAGEA